MVMRERGRSQLGILRPKGRLMVLVAWAWSEDGKTVHAASEPCEVLGIAVVAAGLGSMDLRQVPIFVSQKELTNLAEAPASVWPPGANWKVVHCDWPRRFDEEKLRALMDELEQDAVAREEERLRSRSQN